MRNPPFPRLMRLSGAAALVAAAVMAAGPASAVPVAAGPVAAGPGFGPRHWPGGPDIDAGNWAGYAATGQKFTSISGSWVEPVATCKAHHDLYAPWLGIDGYGDQTVEQTGVQTSCSTGAPVDSGWFEMYPAAPVYFSNPVSTGDTIDASVTYTGGKSYTLVLEDVTKGWTHTVRKTLKAKNASAEAIIEAPGGFPALPDGVTFTGVTVDGQPLSTFSPAKLTSAGFRPGKLTGGTFTIRHR